MINVEKILVPFIFTKSWGLTRHFSKSRRYDDFFKNDPKLGGSKPQFEGKFDVSSFFVPINFHMDFLYKIGANFEFLAKTGLVSDLFLNGFLCENEDHWLSADSKLEPSTTYPLFGRWMVGGVQLFGSLNLLIIIRYIL